MNKVLISFDSLNSFNNFNILFNNGIFIYKVSYKGDLVNILICECDLDKVKKLINVDVVRYYSFSNIFNFFVVNIKYLLLYIIILFIILFFKNFILDIEVFTSNIELKNEILSDLSTFGIKKRRFAVSEKDFEKIEDYIAENNSLEWINVERNGMKYFVSIMPKISSNKNKQNLFCNVVSTKDGIITKIIASKGLEKIDVGDSVKQGDVLLSGEVLSNDESKRILCANGKVYANTWYRVHFTFDRNYINELETDKYKYNVLIFSNKSSRLLLRSKYNNYNVKNVFTYDFVGYGFSIVKTYKLLKENKIYSDDEIMNKIDNLVIDKLKNKYTNDIEIVDRKVLKKSENNSKIDIELFVVAEENIGKTVIIEE